MRFYFSNFILEKHVTCEPCGDKVNGGFDPEKKQVRQIEFKELKY